MISTISRLYGAFFPPIVEKKSGALRFGILGAATAAYVSIYSMFIVLLTVSSPLGLVVPAKSHSEIILQAISARDRTRAEAFAKKHGIPDVRDTYQG
jgi:predicted dehydrogenase